MIDDDQAEYVNVETAAEILRIVPRQVNRYGSGDHPRLRTRKAGRRILYHRGDVQALALDLDVANKAKPPAAPRHELMPAGEVLTHISRLTDEIAAVHRQAGQLEGTVEMQRQRIAELEAERDELRRQLTASRRPWWQFWTR